jgi:chloramphenicol-sensitive protein RarD
MELSAEPTSMTATRVAAAPPLASASPADAPDDRSRARAGLAFALAAYVSWGVIPTYFKLLTHVPPLVILAHRIVWSVVFLAVLLSMQGKWDDVRAALRSRRTVLALLCSTTLIAVNWFVFIWAVTNGRLLQASLGYFINPLVNVLLGVLVLRERLSPGQMVGLALATAGVSVLTVSAGGVPWVALSLAFSFALYGLIRKMTPVGPVAGLSVETAILFPASLLGALGMLPGSADASFAHLARLSGTTFLLLAAAGVITALPLLWFAAAARRLRLSTLGFIQYLAPTCQFLLAVLVYREPFNSRQLLSFTLIWAALGAYTLETAMKLRRDRAAAREADEGTPVCVPE